MQLSAFNEIEAGEAADLLRACAHVDRWAREIAAGRPYASVAEVSAAARACADLWTEAEIDEALARHPRIGERARGAAEDARMSRAEQSGLGITDDVQRRLDEGNAAYEDAFGFVFLIRAAGRTAEEILAELERRMTHTPETERRVAAEQLREIAVLRLEGLLSPMASFITTHVLDAQSGRPAAGIDVELAHRDATGWVTVATGRTDDDGRIGDLGPEALAGGTYRVTFDTGAYFAGHDTPTFYPEVSVTFTVDADEKHYHVPILLSPFAYSTYRGS
ncbi:2-oxo-4-hydroxy-4-carboxy-5-ureidoimidazoline decarboxylase [Pseudactinotalea sp. HY160]|uniref:2-oxo-4-hydroxy-4-carboxy-5-ureidoimidazoline decarboxylase n=1 Tax=Pseudactinotalea sp. HY160 TaxID=2654490 RepID=UPI00351B9C90